jgi:uncharacterized protein with GYD domain
LTRPPQTDPIHAARGSLRHPGWLRRNHRLASVGTGGWFQSESQAVFIGIRNTTAKGFLERPQDRTGPAKALVEGFGGKLLCYYFALGEYDGLGICEFPDAESVVAFSMKASSSGAFARFETTALLTAQEAEAAMKRAKSTSVNYRAPGT